MNNLALKTVSGIQWTTISTVSTSLMQIIYTAVMARLLDPVAFGLVAIAGVVLRFASYFAQMGMSQALIQKKDLRDVEIRTAFTSSFLLGIFFLALVWLLAPLSIYIFDNTAVIPVIRVMAFSFLVTGLGSTAISLMRRNMRFKEMAVIEITAYVLSYLIIGISSAYLGFGVWSLVFASLSSSLFISLFSYTATRHNILFTFKWEYYKPLLAFGSRISFISFLEFLGDNLDTIVIGRLLGPSPLGLYNRAYMLINLPLQSITTSVSKVLFPAFSRLQTEKVRLRKVYLSVISLAAYVLIPAAVGAAVAAEQIVLVVLGEKWIAAIPILQILALSTPFRLLLHFAGILCDATNTLNLKLVLNLGTLALLAGLFFLLKPYGVNGFAVSILLMVLVKNLAFTFITRQILQLKLRRVAKAYLPAICTAVITGGSIYISKFVLESFHLPNILILIAEAFTGIVMLILLLFISLNKKIKSELSCRITHTFGKDTSTIKGKVLTKVSNILSV